MHDPLLMGIGQAAEDLAHEDHGVPDAQRSLALDQVPERGPFDVLEDHVGDTPLMAGLEY